MQITAYNPAKGRLETIEVEYTDENTTWFNSCRNDRDISMITDLEGCLLIRDFSYDYPVLIYDISREDINYDRRIAKKLRLQHV